MAASSLTLNHDLNDATNGDSDPVSDDDEQSNVKEIAIMPKKKLVTLSDNERKMFVHDGMTMHKNMRLTRGCIDELAFEYNISYRTVGRPWTTQVKSGLKSEKNDTNVVIDISHKKTGNCGRKKKIVMN